MMRKGDGKGGSIVTMAREAATTGWGVDRNGRLYAGYNEKYELGVWDPEGTLLFRFGRKFEPVKNPLSKPSAGRTLAARTQPGNLPAFNPDFFFDDDGNLWLPLYRAGDKDPFLYDVFSPDGIYLKQIAAPFRIYQVRGGKAYAIVESEEGFRVLKCFRLELPAAKAGRSPEGR
jgi:sugar lactone lactonase YvrE